MNFHLFCKMVMFMKLRKGLSATLVKLIQLELVMIEEIPQISGLLPYVFLENLSC